MDDDTAALRAEAADPSTPPECLAELVKEARYLPLVVGNPNTPWSTLRLYAIIAPRAFLENPVVPLLLMEDPALPSKVNVLVVRHLVQIDVPLAILFARQHDQDWQIHDELAQHVLEVGEAGPEWEAEYAEHLRDYTGPDYHKRDYTALRRILTRSLAVPPWLIAVLATHHNRIVREIVATSPSMPADVRAWLLTGDVTPLLERDANDPIRHAIVTFGRPVAPITTWPLRRLLNGSDVPEFVLALAARHPKPLLRRKAASHPCAPPHLLQELARDPDELVRQVVAQHGATPPDVLAQLARDAPLALRCILARHPALPGDVLAQLATDSAPQVRRMVAQRADLPASLRIALAGDVDAKVRAAIQPPAPSKKHAAWLKEIQRVRDELTALAPEAILPYCYEVHHGRIVRAIAQDPQTPPHILAALADHRDPQLRVDVAKNSATPDAVLQELAQNYRRYVALAALLHMQAAMPDDDAIQQQIQDQLYWMARLASGDIRMLLRQYHIDVPRNMVLGGDINGLDWLVAVASATTAEPLLTPAYLSTWYGWRTRVALARNPATPPELRAELLRDGNRYVRAAARASMRPIHENS